MDTASTGALKAYTDALKRAQGMQGGPADGASSVGQAQGGSFSEMVKGVVEDAVQQAETSEKVSLNAVAGVSDPMDVVTAITSAEVTLQTVVAVRDKMIQAYQEIIRMPI